MARYGSEYERGARGGRRRMRGPAYGWEYGRVRGYGAAPGYGREFGYGRDFGYGAGVGYGREFGYGAELGYGEEYGYGEETGYGEEAGYGAGIRYRRGRYEYPGEYDYEFGGRGWPYREARWGRRRRPTGYRGRGFRGEYDWEMRGPAGMRMGYGFEYIRYGAPGYRRARGRMPERRGYAPRRPAGRFERRPAYGYEGEFAGGYGGRPAARGYGRGYGRVYERGEMSRTDYDVEMTSRAGMYSGHTPPDRWPDMGHDVDARPSRERDMSDDEIREAVLENLFQDTWVDPDRIEVDVDHGVVTLSGDVRDFMEARYAWDDAWESAGVRGVINNLTVRADRPQEEMEMPQTSGGRKAPAESRR
ncbi:MAG TPA: BON domain-containing protein [Longimicrobiales bacterium]